VHGRSFEKSSFYKQMKGGEMGDEDSQEEELEKKEKQQKVGFWF
jgi:hypothetical protein